MLKLSVIDFWNLYSKRQISYYHYKELSLRLSLNVFFDRIFGMLTRHKFLRVEKESIELICQDCPYILNEKEDICQAHMGILQGQFEKKYHELYYIQKTVNNNVCSLKLVINKNER